jgi:hypothetical protein
MKRIAILTLLLAAGAALIGCEGDPEESTVQDEQGGALTLERPDDVTIEAGGEPVAINVVIVRDELEGPVSIDFSGLPEGVSVVDPDKSIIGDEAMFRLRADADAAAVDAHMVTITARAQDQNMGVSERFAITVE